MGVSANVVDAYTRNPRDVHVMMLPSLGRGHVIPCLRLAEKLVRRGLTLGIVVTTPHITFLREQLQDLQLPCQFFDEIHALELKLLPEEAPVPPSGSINSNTVAQHQLPLLFAANNRLEAPFRRFLAEYLEDNPAPACLIADFLLGWASEAANQWNIPRICLDTCGMYAESIQQVLWERLPRNLDRSLSGRWLVPGLPKEIRLTRRQMLPELPDATPATGRQGFWKCTRAGNRLSRCTLANTVYELEREFVDHFARVNGTIRCVGPLLPAEAFTEKKRGGNQSDACLTWLDAQPDMSVVYVSFGSENSVSASQVAELARGLESSGIKFIWVVRPPSDGGVLSEGQKTVTDYLPEGFCPRVEQSGQGFIVPGWAPQLKVLSHPATGGFLSHCGWNAVMECVSCGVPMIAWPLYAEQHLNSKFVVEEIGIALEAPLQVDHGWFVDAAEISALVRRLVCGDEGRKLREKAGALREVVRAAVREGGSSYRNLDAFVADLLSVEGRRV